MFGKHHVLLYESLSFPSLFLNYSLTVLTQLIIRCQFNNTILQIEKKHVKYTYRFCHTQVKKGFQAGITLKLLAAKISNSKVIFIEGKLHKNRSEFPFLCHAARKEWVLPTQRNLLLPQHSRNVSHKEHRRFRGNWRGASQTPLVQQKKAALKKKKVNQPTQPPKLYKTSFS